MRLLISLILALLIVQNAQARELSAVGTHFPVIFEPAPDGTGFQGSAVDILTKIAGSMGDSVRFEMLPWKRAQVMVETGAADIMIGPYKSPERLSRFAFSEQPFYSDQMMFLSDETRSWSFETLSRTAIGTVLGWSYGPQFESRRKDLNLTEAATIPAAVHMLKAGHVDMIAVNRRNVQPYLNSDDTRKFVFLTPPIAEMNGYFAFPRKPEFDQLRHDFDAAFAKIVQQRAAR